MIAISTTYQTLILLRQYARFRAAEPGKRQHTKDTPDSTFASLSLKNGANGLCVVEIGFVDGNMLKRRETFAHATLWVAAKRHNLVLDLDAGSEVVSLSRFDKTASLEASSASDDNGACDRHGERVRVGSHC